MKYFIRLTNENGKEIGLAANEYIDIDIMHSNKRIKALTMREGDNGINVYDEDDLPVIPIN